jgi:hypothetical protein
MSMGESVEIGEKKRKNENDGDTAPKTPRIIGTVDGVHQEAVNDEDTCNGWKNSAEILKSTRSAPKYLRFWHLVRFWYIEAIVDKRVWAFDDFKELLEKRDGIRKFDRDEMVLFKRFFDFIVKEISRIEDAGFELFSTGNACPRNIGVRARDSRYEDGDLDLPSCLFRTIGVPFRPGRKNKSKFRPDQVALFNTLVNTDGIDYLFLGLLSLVNNSSDSSLGIVEWVEEERVGEREETEGDKDEKKDTPGKIIKGLQSGNSGGLGGARVYYLGDFEVNSTIPFVLKKHEELYYRY